MAKIFNKRSIKHILSSTALIGALLFSNTVSVSAEEATPVEDNIVEVEQATDKSNTYESEDNEPVEESEKTDDSEGDKQPSNDELPQESEDSSETDENKESDQDKNSDTPSESNGESEKDDSKRDEESNTDELEDMDELPRDDESTEDSSVDEETEKEDSAENEEELNNKDDLKEKEETDSTDTEDSNEKSEKEDDEVKDSEKKAEKETKEEDSETDSDESQEDPASENNQVFSSLMSTYSTARTQSIQNDGDFVERISGANRSEIAAAISQRGWSSSDTVFVSNGFKDADALTGSPLASAHDAPILFTRDTYLPDVTLNEIRRLGATNVVIIGGSHSVPTHIIDTLESNSLNVQRIDGNNRYDLAAEIAGEVMEVEGKDRDAFLVNGDAYADAISVAPVASAKRLPIYLTRANNLHDTVKDAIPYVNSWTILGGKGSISESVVQEMINMGANISRRFDGSNRYEVNRNVINHYGTGGEHTYVASGEVHADALATAGLAGKEGKKILLVKDRNVGNLDKQTEFIKENQGVEEFTLVGGEGTLSPVTENHFVEPLVYLDPGHGGWETGTAHYGIVEKDLNLSISHKADDLLADYGYEVVMSRTTDEQVDLYDRPAEANAIGADILVSVHNNAMPGNSNVSGIETYVYAPSPSYPPLNENIPYHTDPERMQASQRLAEAIHDDLITDTGANDRGVKGAAFVVTREAHMPAVLLELGFVSNYNEAQKLNSNGYQNTLAEAIVHGINEYFGVI